MLDKSGSRSWSAAVDLQLEAVHQFKRADFLLDRVRRYEVAITPKVFSGCMVEANPEIAKLDRDDRGSDEQNNDIFADKARFPYMCFIGKLITELYGNIAGVTGTASLSKHVSKLKGGGSGYPPVLLQLTSMVWSCL